MLQGPFTTFKLQQDKDCDWTGLKFSPDGKLILVSTNGQVIRLIDAFQGTPLQTFMVGLPIGPSGNLGTRKFLLVNFYLIFSIHNTYLCTNKKSFCTAVHSLWTPSD